MRACNHHNACMTSVAVIPFALLFPERSQQDTQQPRLGAFTRPWCCTYLQTALPPIDVVKCGSLEAKTLRVGGADIFISPIVNLSWPSLPVCSHHEGKVLAAYAASAADGVLAGSQVLPMDVLLLQVLKAGDDEAVAELC